jgi:hypothetical protein
MPATASSISLVTWVSISAGAAPGCTTVIETSGTSMLGKRVIGRVWKDCQPSMSSMKNASSGATGLRIDQAEKFMSGGPRSQFVAVSATGVIRSPGRTKAPALLTTLSPAIRPATISTQPPSRMPV